MNHLPISGIKRSNKKSSFETYLVFLLVGAAVCLFTVALSHHNKAGNSSMASSNTPVYTRNFQSRNLAGTMPAKRQVKGAMFRLIRSVHSAARTQYPVHLKTLALNTYTADHDFPNAVKVYVDGKQVFYKSQGVRKVDFHVGMTPGKHAVVIAMWDQSNKMTTRQFIVPAGPVLNYMVAQNRVR